MLEDDPQNGTDHVDARSSLAYLAGWYVKRHFIDHIMYNTSSMIHTTELILGMPLKTQYSSAAVPMWHCFSQTPDVATLKLLSALVNLKDIHPHNTMLAAMLKGLNFLKEVIINDLKMYNITCKAVKGENSLMPTHLQAAFLKTLKKFDDADD